MQDYEYDSPECEVQILSFYIFLSNPNSSTNPENSQTPTTKS